MERKEAIEVIKKNWPDSSFTMLREALETIIPELKESEDERIRKGIIRNLEYLADRAEGFVKDELKERIAWLEKQSYTIPDECVFRPVVGCDIKSAAEQAIKQQGVLAKEVVLAFNGAYIPVKGKAQDIIVKEYNSWLEKQGTSYTKKDVDDAYLKGVTDTKNEIGKQYEANYQIRKDIDYQIRKDIATFIFNYRGDIKDRAKWMNYLGIKVSFAEMQDKQKPANKVEPKFKKE